MRFSIYSALGTVVAVSLLVACKSGSPPPTEVDQEATNDVEQSADQQPEPTAVPAIPAPPDVAAAPADAEKSKSGLAWKVLQKGEGDRRPGRYDIVTLNYTGWTPDGRMFLTSQKPSSEKEDRLEEFMPGWLEGVQLMLPGEKRRFWIPGKLAYGESDTDSDEPDLDRPKGPVVCDIELVDFQVGPRPPRPIPEDVAEVPQNAERSKSGLAWRVLEKGTGKEHPAPASVVSIHYAGWTTDGKMVSSSFTALKPATFVVGDAMPGWREAIPMMVVGETRRLWIPQNLAFGGRPGYTEGMLVYDIQLVEIKNLANMPVDEKGK